MHDTPWSQNFRLSKPPFYTSNIFFHDTVDVFDVFTHKRISPDLSFKSNQRPENISILTLQCGQFDFAV